jgi:hypothetical protein
LLLLLLLLFLWRQTAHGQPAGSGRPTSQALRQKKNSNYLIKCGQPRQQPTTSSSSLLTKSWVCVVSLFAIWSLHENRIDTTRRKTIPEQQQNKS